MKNRTTIVLMAVALILAVPGQLRGQTGVLVQVGLLDPKGLPVSGGESAQKVLDPSRPARKI